MKIKELPKVFEKKCIKYTQLVRKVYDVTDENGETKKDGYLIYKCDDIEDGYSYYEVFRYRLIPQHPYSKEDYDMVEAYPTDNQFGLYAWCCSNLKCLERVLKKHFDVDINDLNIF